MACSIVASHTRGSSTYGLRNEAGDARHRRRSRWPHQHTPGCWFCHILYTFPHICIWQIIYAERIWADGSSSSRNRAAPIAFVLSFYENSVPPRTGGSRDTSSRPAPLLARQTRLPGPTDNTRYGEGRASPRSFLTHHVANISTAIQTADAQTILNARAHAPGAVSCMGSTCKV